MVEPLLSGATLSEGSGQMFFCIHDCGTPVSQPGFACAECAEEQLPPELQKQEGDQVLLIRNRSYKHEGLRAQDAEEKPILLRPKLQTEQNSPHDQRRDLLNGAADAISKCMTYTKSAEGADFWHSITRMLREKAWEFDPKNQKKKK